MIVPDMYVCIFVIYMNTGYLTIIILIYVTVIILSENYFKNAQRDTIILL